MWFAVGLLVICFTIIVLFRMYIDLRRVDHQHIRLLQSDIRGHERYQQVRQLEAPKPAMPDFRTAVELSTAAIAADRYRIDPRDVGYYDTPFPKPTPEQVRALEPTVMYKKAHVDTRLLNDRQLQHLIDVQYNEFIEQQRRRKS
jgi:hypothetical protein